MRVIIVCGGRNYTDENKVNMTLLPLHIQNPIDILVQGGAKGADALARDWAKRNGITLVNMPADWKTHGRAAGLLRNQRMAEIQPKPELLVAFPGGRGTADMIHRARKTGIPVMEIS